MYINFRNRNSKKNILYNSKNTESKINTTTSSSINVKNSNISRNIHLISLHKKRKSSKIYLHTSNNIKTRKKISEERKYLFHNNSKEKKQINNIYTLKGASYTGVKSEIHNKDNLFMNKHLINEN